MLPADAPSQTSPSQRSEDIAVKVADTVDNFVGAIRDRATEPVLVAVRAVVYGLLAAVLGLAAMVLLTIAIVRFVDAYLPGEVWSAHLLTGGVFTIAGLVCWRLRRPRQEDR